MLTRLHIRNYAIISELDVELNEGLTIITGETGAGKSILIGALSLVLGKRADATVLYNESEKCVVEAFFNISGYELEPFFAENDLDFENPTILRREINANGKSRAFINDTPVTLLQLKDLASKLIDIHSQHEVLTLKSAEFRARFLDLCADGGKQSNRYQLQYAAWNTLRKEVETLRNSLAKSAADEDYLKFQLEELLALNLKEGELAENQERLSLLENAEEITVTLSGISDMLQNGENPLVDSLRKAETELQRLAKKYPSATEWAQRIKQSLIDLEDVAEEMNQRSLAIDQDPAELQRLEERVDEILRLMTKHRVQSESELIQFQAELDEKLLSINNSDEKLTILNGRLEIAESLLQKEADKLTETRKAEAKRISPILAKELQQLGMPDAQMNILIEPSERSSDGQDRIEILFTANKGQKPQDISKIASGGELSRLMLSVKAEMASKTQLPAIIFDEIDTGVSGDVADKMGGKIKDLSKQMQILCITHLPQIASKADQHLFVYKEEQEGRAVTGVRKLDEAERILEIAKMLSNANPTEAALAHAKNLVNLNN
ncbi:MAG: DNA repair protein RecN [Flavobacteriales bacterium]|nr:DNA repair protein RecN [Flavobacteriales bacterium]